MHCRQHALLGTSLLAGLLAAAPLVQAAPRSIVFDPAATDGAPNFTLADSGPEGCRVTVTVGTLQVEDIDIAGQSWQVLTLPGGETTGEPGTPGLPTCGGLVAVPPGCEVFVTATVRDREALAGLRPLPVQGEDAAEFQWDQAAYAGGGEPLPAVTLGPIAIVHGVRVVPFLVHPVQYDAARGEVSVATELDLEFSFPANGPPAESPRRIGESFARLLANSVINWPAVRDGFVDAGRGTWLCIHDSDAGVTERIAPLAQWRRRQGYNVIVASTAVTGTSSTQIKAYIQGIYDSIDPPLEYVCLVGDANGTISVACMYEGYSGFNGENDHGFTTLEGGDLLADIHIGRLSCRNLAELQNIVTKIVAYETAPPTTDPGWFTRATVTGDPTDSGMTVVYVAQWVKSHLSRLGYTQIDTIFSAPFSSRMYASCNQGVSVFAYRGFYNVSGMSAGYIDALSNGVELPFAVLPTCDSGSFATATHCYTEAFLRNANGGAIGAIGTATVGTHTRYNNCYFGGVWEGALNSGDRHLGAAHTRGKLELYRQYADNESNIPVIWSSWNNLMGDPATEMWQALPTVLTVTHPAVLPVGANALPVAVSAPGGPVAGARVAAVKDGEIRAVGLTDASGEVVLPLPAHTAGSLLVTITGQDRRPYQGSVTLGTVDAFATAESMTFNDDEIGGGADGRANPGETLSLMIAMRNLGNQTAGAVTVTLASDDSLTVADPTAVSFGDIPAGALVWRGPFVVQVQPEAPDLASAGLRVTAVSGVQTWISRLELPITAAKLVVIGSAWSLGSPQAGQTGELTVTIRNDGSRAAAAAVATLRPQSPYLLLAGPATAAIGALPIGGTAAATFNVHIREDCWSGHLAALDIALVTAEGSAHALVATMSVGAATVTSPTGPDAYGYLALDNLDTHPNAPVYAWVELDPAYGGSGQDVGLTDFGYEQDDTRTVDLPFACRYYGRPYQQISICSNGWASFGASSLCEFFNWYLPCPGVPRALLAVFWDDLRQTGTNRVYQWYDAAGGRYIVQWSRMRNDNNGINNCELILYDPATHPTLTGDGLIVYQYQAVNNNDYDRGYCTVGIQSPDGADGITWTYYNDYALTSRALQAGRAIKFLPTLHRPAASGAVAPELLAFTLGPGQTETGTLTLSAVGDAGTLLSFSITVAGESLPGWLAIDPPRGQIPADQSVPVAVTANAGDLLGGVYEAEVVISHNAGAPLVIPVQLTVDVLTSLPEPIPAALTLVPAYPNPFNPRCEVRFSLPASGTVVLSAHDLSGRRVAELVSEVLPAGAHRVAWDGTGLNGRRLASGTYILRLASGGEVRSQKVVLVK
jgi:hypothetical protein